MIVCSPRDDASSTNSRLVASHVVGGVVKQKMESSRNRPCRTELRDLALVVSRLAKHRLRVLAELGRCGANLRGGRRQMQKGSRGGDRALLGVLESTKIAVCERIRIRGDVRVSAHGSRQDSLSP